MSCIRRETRPTRLLTNNVETLLRPFDKLRVLSRVEAQAQDKKGLRYISVLHEGDERRFYLKIFPAPNLS